MNVKLPLQKITPINIKNTEDIPEDAVLLTESEALRMQWEIINDWKPRRDVWPLTYGVGLLGVAAGITGYIANKHYRKSLNLLHHAKVASYIPLVILPTALGGFLHHVLVSKDIVLYKKVCPVCMESRAMAIQTFCGVVYPMVMAPCATFHLANRLYTYPIPPISKELWRTYTQLTKPLVPKVIALFLLNVGIAMFISLEEVRAIHRISLKIDEMLAAQ